MLEKFIDYKADLVAIIEKYVLKYHYLIKPENVRAMLIMLYGNLKFSTCVRLFQICAFKNLYHIFSVSNFFIKCMGDMSFIKVPSIDFLGF